MEGRYYRKHWPEYEDLGWNYYGCPTAIDTQSNWRKESSSSGPTDSVLERKWRCSSPVKLVSLCLTIILLALICGIIYLSHLKDQNIRYYTSEGTLTINQAYTPNLRNTNSEEYSSFTYKFCAQMERTFKSNSSPYGTTYQSCDVQSLTPGSIIVTFTLYFLDTITVTNEEVISVITSSVSVVNSNTVFGDFIVDTSTLSVTTTLQVYEQDPLPEIKSINLPSTSTTSTSYPSTEMVTTSSTKTTEASTTQTTSTTFPSTEMVTTSSTKTTEASTTQTTSTTFPSTEMVTTSSTKTTEASTTQTTSTASPSTEMVTTSSTKTEASTTQKTSTTDAPTSMQSTIVQTTASVLTTDKMTANPATTISTTDEPTSMQSTAFQTTSSASTTDKMTSNPLSTITSPTQSLKNETTTAVSKAVENITKISTTEESMSTQLPTVESTQTLSKSSTTIESTTTDLTSKSTSTMSNTVQSTLESSTTHKSTSVHLPTVESTVESTSKPLTTVEITTTQLPEVKSTSTIPTTTETTPEQSTSYKTTLAPLITVEAISTNSTMVTPTSSGSNSTENTTMESTEQNSTTSTKEITTQEPLKTVETTSVTPLTVKTTSDSLQTAKISTTSSTRAIGTSFISTAPKTTASQTTMIGASTEDSATVISENTSSSLSAVQTTTEVLSTTAVESTPTIQSTSQISISSSTGTITTELSSTENSISPSTDTTVETKSTSTTETLIMTTPTSYKTTENHLTSTQNVSTTESLTTDIHNTTSTSTFSTYGNTTMYNTTSTPVSPTYVDTTIYNTTTTLDSSSTYVNITMYNTTSTTESSLYLNTTDHNATLTVSPTYENTAIYNITSTSDFTLYENTTILNTTSTSDSSTYVNPTIHNITSTTESSTFENTTNYNITSSTMLPSTNMSLDYTSLSTTDHTQTTTSSYISKADVSFPSATVLAKVDITLVCTIKVRDVWSIITAGQELDSDISVLAEYFINGTVSEKTVNYLTTVTFTGDNETIIVAFNIHLSSVAVCPSLLRLTCGIKMMDFAESSITNVSVVHITAPVSNVTLDMSPSFYTGERLELTCRTKTDFEYGDVALEVQFPDGSRLQEPAMRSKYSTTRNGDCTVDFEWIFKSEFSFEQNMNGSIIHCVASNRLLNHTVITSRVVILLTSDVSFAQYYVSGKPGDEVSITCNTNIAAPSIQNISIYKISNNTNVTITTYSNGMVTNSPGTSGLGNFQNRTLTVVFTSLQCSDEAQYFCTVTYGSTQITSPLFLTLQPTTTAGSTPVSLSLSVDIVEETFRYTSAHYCSGEIGYPEVNGFLSLTFTNPKTKEAVIYNEKMLLNSTKIIVTTISLNKVILADGLILLIREDVKLNENCSTIQRMKFYLNVSNQWNHGQIKCEIQTEDGPVLSSEKEEVFFVIPVNACGDFNGTGTVYIDHEIMDHCNTYIECMENHPPFGSKCVVVDHCASIGGKSCDDCSRAKCTEVPNTSVLTTPFSTFPTTAGTKGNLYLECASVSVFLKQSAHISCHLNISNILSLNVSKSNSSLLSVQSDGTVTVSSPYSGRLVAVFSLSSLNLDIIFQSTSCEDDGLYSVKMEFDRAESYITSFTVSLKVKPETPKLRFHPNLIEGENLRSHACTGEVGHPPGKLEIEIKRPGDTEFSTYHPAGQERIYSEVVGNCSSIQTLDFSIDLSSDSWNNVTARCIALNAVAFKQH